MSRSTVSILVQSTAGVSMGVAYDTKLMTSTTPNLADLAAALMPTVADAGAAIMAVYEGAFSVQKKDDNSPLTQADLESQRVILDGLSRLTPDIPVLSEESAHAPWSERQNWTQLWVVDPLDGTREFVKRNGEFTINIALVVDHEPLLGIVAAPALGLVVLGCHRRRRFQPPSRRARGCHQSLPAHGTTAGGGQPLPRQPRHRQLSRAIGTA